MNGEETNFHITRQKDIVKTLKDNEKVNENN